MASLNPALGSTAPAGYAVFHLNLAFSSIAVNQRPRVIRACYHPLLDLAERGHTPLGLEINGLTLDWISRLDPSWIHRLKRLCQRGAVELVAGGYVQLIGPLTPCNVNLLNLYLGLEACRRHLEMTPGLLLINEMAFSSGMVDVAHIAGYHGVIMDEDNLRHAVDTMHPPPCGQMPSQARGSGGRRLPVLWCSSVAFQKFQRLIHQQISEAEYLDFLGKCANTRPVLPMYCSDTEVFGFRPGRFADERWGEPESEWSRIHALWERWIREGYWTPVSPSKALALSQNPQTFSVTDAAYPCPVKKQPKYNLSRWAVTGRRDLWLNTRCHSLARAWLPPLPWTQMPSKEIVVSLFGSLASARRFCTLWGSDYRTHITAARWRNACGQIKRWHERHPSTPPVQALPTATRPRAQHGWTWDEDRSWVRIHTRQVDLTLNAQRGMTIRSLMFPNTCEKAVFGTLDHGVFQAIHLAADFYSGGFVMDLPCTRRRVTDLIPCRPAITTHGPWIQLEAAFPLGRGSMRKIVMVHQDLAEVKLIFDFQPQPVPRGSLRAGNLTVMPGFFQPPLHIACHNGGPNLERFLIKHPCLHDIPVSPFVSCTTGFGASSGTLHLQDRRRCITLQWDPAQCAAFPMLHHEPSAPHAFTRIVFSLAEWDDTSKPTGTLPRFELRILPGASSVEIANSETQA